jgi:hypothetical protein
MRNTRISELNLDLLDWVILTLANVDDDYYLCVCVCSRNLLEKSDIHGWWRPFITASFPPQDCGSIGEGGAP